MIKLSGSYRLASISLPEYGFQLKSEDFKRSGDDFTIWFLEGVLKNNPNYVDCLLYLGNAYTARGRYKDGLKVDMKLAELQPGDSIVRYNLACSYCLVGDLDAAIRVLEIAVALGYEDVRHLENDKDLEGLRGDKRYWELLDRIKGKGTVTEDKEGK